jgi:hypothetical protein
MASKKQLEANRQNARKSTGPGSQGGKARSRLNSRKHGLTAKMLIIVGENANDFEQLRAELMDDPQSALECELVERLSGILWRLRRVPFFEAAIMDARHRQAGELQMGSIYRNSAQTEEEEEETDWQKSVHFGYALINDASWSDALGKLARHEATLMRPMLGTARLIQKSFSITGLPPICFRSFARSRLQPISPREPPRGLRVWKCRNMTTRRRPLPISRRGSQTR